MKNLFQYTSFTLRAQYEITVLHPFLRRTATRHDNLSNGGSFTRTTTTSTTTKTTTLLETPTKTSDLASTSTIVGMTEVGCVLGAHILRLCGQLSHDAAAAVLLVCATVLRRAADADTRCTLHVALRPLWVSLMRRFCCCCYGKNFASSRPSALQTQTHTHVPRTHTHRRIYYAIKLPALRFKNSTSIMVRLCCRSVVSSWFILHTRFFCVSAGISPLRTP